MNHTPRPTGAEGATAPLPHAAIMAIMTGILLAMFLSALEQTIVAPALPTIGRALGHVENLSWTVTAYLLATTAATPLFGKLADIHGRRRTILAAIAIFTVGSVVCALAPTMSTLIAGRALQGFGGGGILPIAQTIIGDLVSPRERPRYQSYTSIMFLGAAIAGPVMGGVLTDYMHWTMIFWINLPMGLIALWMTDRTLRKLPRRERRHQLDVPGAVLMVSAAMALMLAMSWGGTRYLWVSLPILGLLALSLVLWIAFALRVAVAPEPFIPLAILREPIVGATAAAGFFSVGVAIGLSIFLPLYFELVLGFSPSRSGVALIAYLAAATIGSFIAGRIVLRAGRYKRVQMAGLLTGVVMLSVLASRPAGLSLFEVCALLFVGGNGIGVMYPLTTTVVQNAVAPNQLGIATGALSFARQLGGAIIVAAFSAIVLGGIGMSGRGLTLEMLHGHLNITGADFAEVFRWLFAAGAVFLALGFIAVAIAEERPLRGARAGAAPIAAE